MRDYWFHHVHLTAPDPAVTARYYEKMFGVRFGVRNLYDGRAAADLDLNGTLIRVMQPRPRFGLDVTAQNGLEHFGVCTDDLDSAVVELKALGANFVQEITEPRPRHRISFMLTPDNALIEVMERER